MKYYCNPINVPYAYSFKAEPRDRFRLTVNREAADPSMVLFQGRYYLFASMTGAVWVSEDMAFWECHRLPENLPVYDYAPDVRVVCDWLYFTASNRGKPCHFYRTRNPVQGPYEKINGVMEYWDPNLFLDNSGRIYLYWGCDNRSPIKGVELCPDTMAPVGEAEELIFGNPWENGYERFGENHSENPRTEKEIDECFSRFLEDCKDKAKEIPDENYEIIRATFSNMPYIEGPWMTRHNDKYYLQYACPGAEINVYADGVYVGDSPLGPFTQAKSNPFSYKPGGFFPGAGHGSTMEDRSGSWWHAATMRISKNHIFERRVGIWPAGFDEDGTLFCNQRYGDWPMEVEKLRKNPWADPEWMLLSYNAKMTSSGAMEGHPASFAADENVQTWWKADTYQAPWLIQDLGEAERVFAVQINFADDMDNKILCPGEMVQTPDAERFIDFTEHITAWLLEGSLDGTNWFVLEDKRNANTDLPHDLIVWEEGKILQYLRLTVTAVPYGVNPCISGLRAFGLGNGAAPPKPKASVNRMTDKDMVITVIPDNSTVGYNILWGNDPGKLYHSWMVMGSCKEHRVGALVKGQNYFVRVDAFNKNGISPGDICLI